jgi:hypothetical protein
MEPDCTPAPPETFDRDAITVSALNDQYFFGGKFLGQFAGKVFTAAPDLTTNAINPIIPITVFDHGHIKRKNQKIFECSGCRNGLIGLNE